MRSADLQYIANNLPDSFTDYKGVIQSYNPENMPERVEVPTKTTQLPVQSNRGRSTTIVHQDSASCKQGYEGQSVNASQLHVDRHLMGSIPSGWETSTNPGHSAHNDRDIGIPDLAALGNREQSPRVTIFPSNLY